MSNIDLLIVAASSYDDSQAAEWHPDLRLSASYLRRNGIATSYLYVPSAAHPAGLIEVIARDRPLALFLHLSEENRAPVMGLSRTCRAAFPDLRIFAGGIPAALSGESLLEECVAFDFAITSEREAVLLGAVERLRLGREPNDVPGLRSRGFLNPSMPLLDDLDALGTIVLDGVDELVRGAEEPTAFLRSSRGCYGRCSFCGIPGFYGNSGTAGWRGRSPALVADEMQMLSERFGIHRFVFEDDDFIGPGTFGRERACRIAEEILRRGLDVRYSTCCRVNDVDEPTLIAMKRSGLAAIGVSVESANQESLNLFRKGQKADGIYRTLGLFERLDIPCEVNLIFFDPYLSLSGVRANLELLRYVLGSRCLVYSDAFPFSELRAFPWTPLVRQLHADGLLDSDGAEYRYRDVRVGKLADFVRGLRRRMPISFKKRTLFADVADEDAAAALRSVASALRDWAGRTVMRYVEAACEVLDRSDAGIEEAFAALERDFDRDIALLHELNRCLSVPRTVKTDSCSAVSR